MAFTKGEIVWAKQAFCSPHPALVIDVSKQPQKIQVSFFPRHQTAFIARSNIYKFPDPRGRQFIQKKGIREAVEWAAEYAYSKQSTYGDLLPVFDELLDGKYFFIAYKPGVLAADFVSVESSVGGSTSPPQGSNPSRAEVPLVPDPGDPATSAKPSPGTPGLGVSATVGAVTTSALSGSKQLPSTSRSDTPGPSVTAVDPRDYLSDPSDDSSSKDSMELTTMVGMRPFSTAVDSDSGSEDAERAKDPDYVDETVHSTPKLPPVSQFKRPKQKKTSKYDDAIAAVATQTKCFEDESVPAVVQLVVENMITIIEQGEKPPLTRKRQRKEDAKSARKRLKNSGEAYMTKSGVAIVKKSMAPVNCRCWNDCSKIPEDARLAIFNGFWAKSYNDQQSFLLKHVSKQSVKRHRSKKDSTSAPADEAGSRRANTVRYSLTVSGQQQNVCRNMFLGTLSITESRIKNMLKREEIQQGLTPEDKRGKHTCSFKTPEANLEAARQFLRQLPTTDSHYRRSDSTRRYLQPGLSINALHKQFSEETSHPLGLKLFSNLFNNEFNYSFEPPRKDVCDECHIYSIASDEEKLGLQDRQEAHIRRMKQAFQAKKEDTAIAVSDSSVVAATFDMEKVLVTPCTPVSNMHYTRKLSTFNFTVWNNGEKTVTCYVWNQTTGKKGSAETSTALFTWLNSLPPGVRRVVLYSDTAAGQNRNRALAAMFSHFLATSNSSIEVIEQKFMESGHSHMEVDSAHSAIERASKSRLIYVPGDWIKIMKEKNYQVVELGMADWLDFPGLADRVMKNRNRTSANETVNWLKFKSMLYSKTDQEAFYAKYELGDINYFHIPFDLNPGTRQAKKQLLVRPGLMYSGSSIPVPKLKLRDLQQIATKYLPKDDRQFYLQLTADEGRSDDEEEL